MDQYHAHFKDPMSRRYRSKAAYRLLCMTTESPYYEQPLHDSREEQYSLEAPPSWRVEEDETWRYYYPPNMKMPDQGWKIHVGAIPATDDSTLHVASSLLFHQDVPFKHLVGKRTFRQSMMKNADRSSSGKFITIYPQSEIEFIDLLERLDEALAGQDAPYILSDVRYGKAPVFFRYGGFRRIAFSNDRGESCLAIARPNGDLIEDVRSTSFVLPDFVSVPLAIRDQVNDRLYPNSDGLKAALHPYVIQSCLHFSNGGGVYLAKDLGTGQQVVAKEARPFAGYTSDFEDSVKRLRHERDMLIRLSGCNKSPYYLDYREYLGHEFLFEEYLDGVSLQDWIASRYPFSLGEEEVASYGASAFTVAQNIVKTVKSIHDQGIALIDMSARNLIVAPDLSVRFVDFEAAVLLESDVKTVLATPGFAPLRSCSHGERDKYGLCCILLYLFWPSWASMFTPQALWTAHRNVVRHFPEKVGDFLAYHLRMLSNRVMSGRGDFTPAQEPPSTFEGLLERYCNGIRESGAQIDDKARLYPGDATQYLQGPQGMVNVETGVAGVALMLFRAGEDVSEDVEWLLSSTARIRKRAFHGLLRGYAGIAAVLCQLGHSEDALGLLPEQLPDCLPRDVSVRSGIAGTVLALLNVLENASSERAYALLRDASSQLASIVSNAEALASPGSETGNAIGLFDGWAGAALACRELALSGKVGEEDRWHSLMHECLQNELSGLRSAENDSLYVDYQGIDYGYLSEGSAGVAAALSICDPFKYSGEIAGLRPGITQFNSLNGGLFRGLAGKLAALSIIDGTPATSDGQTMLRNVVGNYSFAGETGRNSLFFLGDGGRPIVC